MLNPKDDWIIWSSPYAARQMSAQLRRMWDRWAEGLADFQRVVTLAQGARRRTAELDYGVARILDYTFRSFANALDFYQARDQGDAEEMRRIAARELEATIQAYHCVLADSRLGWEAQLQYYYQPSDVLERLLSLEAVLSPRPETGFRFAAPYPPPCWLHAHPRPSKAFGAGFEVALKPGSRPAVPVSCLPSRERWLLLPPLSRSTSSLIM